jgi:hypothetical protein
VIVRKVLDTAAAAVRVAAGAGAQVMWWLDYRAHGRSRRQ